MGLSGRSDGMSWVEAEGFGDWGESSGGQGFRSLGMFRSLEFRGWVVKGLSSERFWG